MTGNCAVRAGRRETIIVSLGRLANLSGVGECERSTAWGKAG